MIKIILSTFFLLPISVFAESVIYNYPLPSDFPGIGATYESSYFAGGPISGSMDFANNTALLICGFNSYDYISHTFDSSLSDRVNYHNGTSWRYSGGSFNPIDTITCNNPNGESSQNSNSTSTGTTNTSSTGSINNTPFTIENDIVISPQGGLGEDIFTHSDIYNLFQIIFTGMLLFSIVVSISKLTSYRSPKLNLKKTLSGKK